MTLSFGNVYDPPCLRRVAMQVAPSRVCLGTDDPFDIMQADPRGDLERVAWLEAERTRLLTGAARRFMKRDESGEPSVGERRG